MGRVRIAGHSPIDQSAPHDASNAVDQRVLDTAVRDVDHSVSTELKQPQFWRAQTAPDGEPRAKSKPRSLPGNHRHFGQTLGARELVEPAARGGVDAGLTEPRATRTGRAVRTRYRCGPLVRLSQLGLACVPAHRPVNLADKSPAGVVQAKRSATIFRKGNGRRPIDAGVNDSCDEPRMTAHDSPFAWALPV
jgi:hypothetical protein